MNTLAQPDLFGDYDREQEAAARYRHWFDAPPPCPACGTQERNGMLLRDGHGVGIDGTISGHKIGEHPTYGGYCAAQHYAGNHIRWAVQTYSTTLDRYVARGRELNLDVDGIIADAKTRRPAHREWLPPGHRYVSLECDQCGHPMGTHRYPSSAGPRCVKDCACKKGPYDGYPNHSHYPKSYMWQRDRLIAAMSAA